MNQHLHFSALFFILEYASALPDTYMETGPYVAFTARFDRRYFVAVVSSIFYFLHIRQPYLFFSFLFLVSFLPKNFCLQV